MPNRNPRTGRVSKAGRNKIEQILALVRAGVYRAPAPVGVKEFQRRRKEES